MSKSDVEMDDTEKLPHDSGNQESENKVVKIESDGQELPSAAAGAGDADKSEDGGEDLNKDRNEEKDETAIKTEVNVHTEPKSEVNEPLVAEGSVQEQVNTESDTAGLIDAKTTAEEPIIPRSGVGGKIDDEIEAVEQNDANSGVEEEKSIEKGIEGGDSLKTALDGKTKEDAFEAKCKEISREDADSVEHVEGSENAKQSPHAATVPKDIGQSPAELSASEVPQIQKAALDEAPQGDTEKIQDKANLNENKPVNDEMKEQHTEVVLASSGTEVVLASSGTEVVLASSGTEVVLASSGTDGNAKTLATPLKHEGGDSSQPQHEISTPSSLVRYSPAKVGDHSGERVKNIYTQSTQSLMGEDDDGTPEEQAAFMKEIESFYRGRAMDFKPPKFYGQPLNCLKLWRATIRLGGYDRVTGSKLWRQVGESFHPPNTCTTVSWTFRIFYEKSLLEYERHKTQSGELQLPAILPEASGVDIEGSGRARRDAAARAMQGWHSQRVSGSGEVGEPIIKDKNVSSTAKREKNLKGLGSLKQKRPNEAEHSIKAARTEASKQLVTSVVDVGPPADWVKVNVRQTKDSFEVYALVPGLLREEVRVQSDPAGRVVITGQPEQADNPWGITAFKKVVSLPARIDPLQTSAVVSLHGRLFVRVPFEQANV